MIHVLITVKESERFPGKNRFLAPYTIVWLLNEIAYIKEQVQVYTVGKRSELPLVLPNGWEHIKTACSDHLQDIIAAERKIKPAKTDVMVLAQVTQPIRESYLLARAVECIRAGNKSCITATHRPDEEWRRVSQGRWKLKKQETALKLTGQLYAWSPGNAWRIFDHDCTHSVLVTRVGGGIVDIDTPADLPPALPAMFSEVVLDSSKQCPLVIKDKKVLLIGSGKDLAGRKLGELIDQGYWDVVVRLNHYYGTPEDVGTRTDLAVLRYDTREKDFIEECPVCPAHILTTNDGINIPKELLNVAGEETGQQQASVGIIAAIWLLQHGAKLTAIGIGHYPDGSWEKQKTYPDGTKDTSGFYDWEKENAWWEARKDIIRLL